MQYGLAFGYVTDRQGGFTNLLLITVCNFIPVVGPIVQLGYRAEVTTRLMHDRDLRRHPKFDFNRFGDYLSRGIWPFLVALVVTVVGLIPVGLAVVAGMAIGAAVAPAAGMIVAICGYVFGLIGLTMVSIPMVLHAEISGRFDLGGGWRFAVQFWKLVGVQAFVAYIVFFPLALMVIVVGLLCCIVGVYPASALVQMAAQHLLVQLYCEYLDRGGEPIPEFDPDEHRGRRRRRHDEYEDDYDDEEYDDYDDRDRRR